MSTISDKIIKIYIACLVILCKKIKLRAANVIINLKDWLKYKFLKSIFPFYNFIKDSILTKINLKKKNIPKLKISTFEVIKDMLCILISGGQ